MRKDSFSYNEYQSVRFFGSLDGIRCFCILPVLWYHAGGAGHSGFLGRGYLGVDMFFILSGFLIVTLLMREKDKHGSISLKDFYARRTLRIFPIYYLLVLGTSFATLFLSDSSQTRHATQAIFPFLLTYTVNFVYSQAGIYAHLWSLSVEEQFYLLWAPVEKLLGRARFPLIAVCIAFAMLTEAGFLQSLSDSTGSAIFNLIGKSPLGRSISYGVLLAYLLHSPASYERVRLALGWRGASAVIAFLLMGLMAVPGETHPLVFNIGVHILMTAFLAACLVCPRHILAFLLNWRPITYIGTISYGMYLYHMHVQVACRTVCVRLGVQSALVLFLMISLITTVVSAMSYHWFELRVLSLRKRFDRTTSGRPVGA